MENQRTNGLHIRSSCLAAALLLLLFLSEGLCSSIAFGFSTNEPQAKTFNSSFVSAAESQLLLQVGNVQIGLQPSKQTSLGSLLGLVLQNDTDPKGDWSYENGHIQVVLHRLPHGILANLIMQVREGCSCETDATLTIAFTGFARRIRSLRDDLDSVITSTSPPSRLTPPAQRQVLIEAMDYNAVNGLYGVAAAFVLKPGITFEVVSLYPFASVSYDPEDNGSIGLAFRKGLGDLSTSSFQGGETKSMQFYLGSANGQQTTDNAFVAFASDAEVAMPTNPVGRPFIFYGVDEGSWGDVRREAESLGYTIIYSTIFGPFTNENGGGHYFGLGWENQERLSQAKMETGLVHGTDGNPTGDGKSLRINPSVPALQTWLLQQIDSLVATRNWFFADGADVVRDFDPEHTNVLEGYVQVLLHVKSTGRAIIYNPYHTPRLWLDWATDGVLIEAPTGIQYEGGRIDYLSSGNFFGTTKEFMRLHSMFFPRRVTVWHDCINLGDSSVLDSIAFFLMERASSFSFSTNSLGSVRVKPGEITQVAGLLTKLNSIQLLNLGSVTAHSFQCVDTNTWRFQVLSGGTVTWLGSLEGVLVDGASAMISFNGQGTTFSVNGQSQVTLLVHI